MNEMHADENDIYEQNPKIIHKLVLTGGPCGGKTTGQSRLSTFFENLGWKVFRVPETATLLMSGGVKWTDLTMEQADRFQQNLIKTMMQIEQTYFDLAEMSNANCIVICDRGVMDPSACTYQISPSYFTPTGLKEKCDT
ncbi:hypothetical protein EB796_020759 [Bugula neritina]|uniref:NadR/Ttd14 AAA domain-containing protein n=1 Tax=Bugula neritina TaxID=10212 RepID=A0A7J7J5N0_BUGNE|nr:hypothetical protein EB796_020759 [Bugula neritina]